MAGRRTSIRYCRIASLMALGLATVAATAAGAGPASAATNLHSTPATVAQAPQPGPAGDRNVRRTPAMLPQSLTMSPGCSATTLPIDCTITEPTVTQAQTTYPFTFLGGDHVTINAGGCVQTGGSGLTWKRYVDPAADNDLYHGTIAIPGTIGTATSQERLVNWVGRPFVVNGRGASLILGYQDDGYSDNGYYAHDNGTGNQCLYSVNAWVHITVS
jgi:hypothetical protein